MSLWNVPFNMSVLPNVSNAEFIWVSIVSPIRFDTLTSIMSSHLNDVRYNKQIDGQIQLKEKKSDCMQNWNWQMGSSKKSIQGIVKKLKNWEVFVPKKPIVQDMQELMNCLCIKRNPTTVRQLLSHIQDFQSKVQFLVRCERILRSWIKEQLWTQTLLRCGSGLPRDAQCCMGTGANVFERPSVQDGVSSAIFNNSNNLASSTQVWYYITIKDTGSNAKRIVQHADSITSLHSSGGLLDHIANTSRGGMMDYRSIFSRNGILEILWLHWILKQESQLQNWGLSWNSRSSDHYALDQRSFLQRQLTNLWPPDRLRW